MEKIDICNAALTRCGAEAISSLDDTSKRAKLVVKQYDITLKELLNDSPWNFAISRTTLAQANEPLFGFKANYLLPSDCIRVLELEDKEDYRVEGCYIVTDQITNINIKYVKFESDPNKYSGSFVKAFALKLAEDISYALVQSASLQAAITTEAERYLRKARSMNSQEGTPESRYAEEYTYGVRQ